MIQIKNLSKVYAGGFQALTGVDLAIKSGEIFALLGPNGAGKTTLINIICGIVNPTSGNIIIDGADHISDYRHARSQVGLVPQELTTDMFEKVITTVNFSRALFGLKPNPQYIEKVLRSLSLWEKRDNKIMTLSGGMKRRVLIAKALAHEPKVLFLDEPTAGVDVELRRDMWTMVKGLREQGVTIILTTHYIEEAQEMADRIGIINGGKIILVEDKQTLMKKLGRKQLVVTLKAPLTQDIEGFPLEVDEDRMRFTITYDSHSSETGIPQLLRKLDESGVEFKDLQTKESSLEDIFVNLVGKKK